MEISMFTYRFRAHTKILPDGAQELSPKASEVTELFLPNRVYRSVDEIGCLLSPGGSIKFDLENSRAYVWFVDTLLSANGKPERPRRIDIWVKAKSEEKNKHSTTIKYVVAVLMVAFSVWLCWWAQHRQWALEERMGVKIAKGWW
jgi:hypothetical protein